MIGEPEVASMVNEIALANFKMGLFFHKFEGKMNCPLCGEKFFVGNVEIYETLVEHVSNDPSIPRVTLTCVNEECKSCNKGYWGEILDGAFYKYSEGEEKLKGDPLGFSDKIPGLASAVFNHEKFEYTKKGLFVGPNWKSKSMKFVYLMRDNWRRWKYRRGTKI